MVFGCRVGAGFSGIFGFWNLWDTGVYINARETLAAIQDAGPRTRL